MNHAALQLTLPVVRRDQQARVDVGGRVRRAPVARVHHPALRGVAVFWAGDALGARFARAEGGERAECVGYVARLGDLVVGRGAHAVVGSGGGGCQGCDGPVVECRAGVPATPPARPRDGTLKLISSSQYP